ncbi:MAG: hypothetical protein MJ211_01595 [Bacteroidales bacterium]|nr:hypothetical protein [Bacteroidales bacterium]
MKTNYIIMSIFLFFLTSCGKNTYFNRPNSSQTTILDDNNMPQIEYFDFKKINIPEKFTIVSDAYIIYDTILLTINMENPQPYIISFFDLKNNDTIAQYFKKGNGPDELINGLFNLKNKELLFSSSNKLIILNIDSILIKKNTYSPKTIFHKYDMFVDFEMINKDTLVVPNNCYFCGCGAESESQYLKMNAKTGELFNFELKEDDKIFFNMNQRIFYYNQKSQMYISAWLRFPMIDIFDKDFNLVKQYYGPDPGPEKFSYFEGAGICIEGEFSRYFYNNIQSEDLIIYGNCRCDNTLDSDYKNLEFWCFDSSCNFVRRLKYINQESFNQGYRMSYCSESGNFYVFFEDENGEGSLYQCIFE